MYREIFLKYFTEGIFPNPSTNFQVMENSTNGAIVKSGFALVRGVTAIMDEDSTIIFEKADSLDRIDRVVLRHDDTLSVRNTSIIILKGTPASTPQPPEITRDSTIWDLVLANVRIRANTNVVTQSQIEDTRLDTSICGIIASTIDTIDTETLYAQIQSDLIQFKENEQADFLEWFNEIKGQLSEDQAGHLQNQIDEIKEQGIMVADTLPIGSVIHWDSEEPYPTDIYEEVNYNPRQLLVNNDFQINQRGKTEYTTKGYSLDMWLLAGDPFNGSLKINDNGTITITNKSTAYMYFSQKMNLQGKYIAVVKVVNKSGNCTQYFGGTNLSKELNVGVNSFGINQNFTEVGIRLQANSSITVEYIDLFEGDIAYPHVKEDKDIALMKCRNYIRRYELIIVDFSYINTNVLFYSIPNGLGKDVTLVVETLDVHNEGMSGQGFTYNGISLIFDDSIVIETRKVNHGFNGSYKCPLKIKYIVSKEPL